MTGPRVVLARLRLFHLRTLRTRPGRSLLSLGVITVSAALIVSVLGIYGSVSGSAGRLAERLSGRAELEITGRTDGGLDPSVLRRAAETEGVAAAVPLVRTPVLLDGERVLLLGTDASAAALDSTLAAVVRKAGAEARPGGDAVLAGPGLAAPPGGERITVQAMTGEQHTVRLAGTLEGGPARRVNSGDYLLAPLPLAQRLGGLDGRLQSVLIVPEAGTGRDTLERELSTALGPQAYVADTSFRAEQAAEATAMVRNVTLLVAFIALVVAGFLVFNTMNMAAAERRSELAALRALGARRRPLTRDFLLEAALLAALGAALGSALGRLLAGAGIDALPPVVTDAVDARIELAMPATAVPAALVACVAAGLASAWPAARRVSRVQPVEALRTADPVTERAEPARSPRRMAALTAGLVLAALAFVVAAAFDDTRSFGATSLFVLGVLLVAYALTRQLVRAASWLAGRFGAPGRIAASAVERAPRRVWATGMTVCLAVAIGAATTGSSQNTVAAASENVSTLADTDVMVQRAAEDVLPVRPLLPRETGRELAAVDGVARAVPGQFTFLHLDGDRVLLQGVGGRSNSTAYRLAAPEARKALREGTGAVVSTGFARDHGLAAGDVLRLPTPHGEQRVRIVDVVDYVSLGAGLVAVSLDRLGAWFGPDGASFYEVQTADGAPVTEVRRRLEEWAGRQPYPVHVLTGAESVAATESAVRQVGALALVLQWIIAGVAALALLNTLMLAVVERRRELGILRALGGSRRYVRRVILAEAAAVSVVGGAAGLLVGTVLHALSTAVMADALALDIPFAPAPAAVALAGGAIVVALAGALPPARRAGRLDVVQAIGYE
ncbi:FtsX-like permease family protein [Streptomyces sp. JJ36]|uniref:ABC transporter permease n=1 Tax=Streptomyces sp. JJ36 TaxID=2736645 RepID=UPI001F3CB374|nr:FtsX-like permease family protein [Streptomyces sp. JJ36]MCF6524478.1 ABC transporter permease [Streptomyces sp. JJ36]